MYHVDYDAMIVSQRYRGIISLNDREAYDIIVDGILNDDKIITVEKPHINIEKLIDYIHYDHPQLFTFRNYQLRFNRDEIIIEPVYLYSHEDYLSLRTNCINITRSIIKPFKTSSSYDKVMGVHNWFCTNFTYEEENEESHSIVGPLLRNKGVCEGFAELFKLLMDMLDVPCSIIMGDVDGEKHAWNCVMVNNKWYHIDVTFDISRTIHPFVAYDYCMITDDEITTDHSIDYKLDLCNSFELNYYVKNNLFLQNQSDLDSLIKRLTINSLPACIDFKLPQVPDKRKASENVMTRCKWALLKKIQWNHNYTVYENLPTMTFRIIVS